MKRFVLATSVAVLVAFPATADAGCRKTKNVHECTFSATITRPGDTVLKNFDGRFKIALEWFEPDFDETEGASWCNLSVWFSNDPNQYRDQISLTHSTAHSQTGYGTATTITAGRSGLVVDRAGVELTPGEKCSGQVHVFYASNMKWLFR